MPEMSHESRLDLVLRTLVQQQRVAALGTLASDGTPFVSMVPYVLLPQGPDMVLHVSGLAAHARHMQTDPRVSLLVMQPEADGQGVHDLGRVTLLGKARFLAADEAGCQECREAYLNRFPEAEMMTQLADFRFVLVRLREARQVAGFGAARSLDAEQLSRCLGRNAPLSE